MDNVREGDDNSCSWPFRSPLRSVPSQASCPLSLKKTLSCTSRSPPADDNDRQVLREGPGDGIEEGEASDAKRDDGAPDTLLAGEAICGIPKDTQG